MKIFILLIITLIVHLSITAQTEQYNLPPGAVIQPKTDTSIDYSYLLTDIQKVNNSAPLKATFLKEISESEWSELEQTNPDAFAYYTEARDYYNALSNKVKAIFTTDQLWHIYFFDQTLKEELLNY